MEIILIRHTTPDIAKGICYGQADIDVTADFEKEAKAIKDKLENYSVFDIYSSPLKRCTQLADFLFDKNYTTDNRLQELNFGDWENKAWDDIPKEEMTPWMTDFVNVRVPNGESYTDLQQRVLAFIEEKKSNNKNMVLVTHAGVIRALKAKVDNISLKDSFQIKVNYGDIFTITV